MVTVMRNLPGSFFGMAAMLLYLTLEHAKLGNGLAFYILVCRCTGRPLLCVPELMGCSWQVLDTGVIPASLS